jgi:hypothetical protein
VVAPAEIAAVAHGSSARLWFGDAGTVVMAAKPPMRGLPAVCAFDADTGDRRRPLAQSGLRMPPARIELAHAV